MIDLATSSTALNSVIVAVVIPCFNGDRWLRLAVESVISQKTTTSYSVEICIFNDGSTDATSVVIQDLVNTIEKQSSLSSVIIKVDGHSGEPRGVAYAKNAAVNLCDDRTKYLCFLDCDDVMLESRIQRQLELAEKMYDDCDGLLLVGSQFVRDPPNSTVRYTKWANGLSSGQLQHQRFTSNGPTLIAPTWFCSKKLFETVGGFDVNDVKGFPEDLSFFYKAISVNVALAKVEMPLVVYRYHEDCATFSVTEDVIWKMRIKEFQSAVITTWTQFTIWNAGKQGKKFYRDLSDENRRKVTAFCDVAENRIKQRHYVYYEHPNKVKPTVPILHFRNATPPFVICVKLDMTNGQLEQNIDELNLIEGIDYYHFN